MYLRVAASAGPTSSPCCPQKIVGGVSYSLVQEADTSTFNCLTNCAYQETGNPGRLFCFAAGGLDAECVSGGNHECEPVVSGLSYGDFHPGGIPDEDREVDDITFQAFNVITNQSDSWIGAVANYWLANGKRVAPVGRFFYDIGCSKLIRKFMIKNTHSADHNNAGTANFKIYVRNEQTEPWSLVVSDRLQDVRKNPNPLFPEEILVSATVARFVRFDIESYYGDGGGLQYFVPM
eukprot:GFUD01109694.1.p1 GENE.GFUD01109694.1~~GFUD01109694.1.p1  ORF type:complete len:264 (+),score=6.00 GFUD01109694.1:88-792(+)